MAQIDDVKAALAASTEAVDAITTKLEEVRTEAVAANEEVVALIAMIGSQPPPDLSEVLVAAQAVQAKTEALKASVQAVDDVLDGIPAVPGPDLPPATFRRENF